MTNQIKRIQQYLMWYCHKEKREISIFLNSSPVSLRSSVGEPIGEWIRLRIRRHDDRAVFNRVS